MAVLPQAATLVSWGLLCQGTHSPRAAKTILCGFLQGKGQPWLCPGCRAAGTSCGAKDGVLWGRN